MSIPSLSILNSSYLAGYANPFSSRITAKMPSIFPMPYIPVAFPPLPEITMDFFKFPPIRLPKLTLPTWKGIKTTVKSYANKAKTSVSSLVNTARKYLGFNEADGSYKKFTNGRSEAWCADFVSHVAKENGVKGFNFSSVSQILSWGKSNGRFSKAPKVGDAIIFKGWDAKRKKYASHTGYVTKIANGKVYTIEGNTSNKVAERSYALNDSKITGYVSIA